MGWYLGKPAELRVCEPFLTVRASNAELVFPLSEFRFEAIGPSPTRPGTQQLIFVGEFANVVFESGFTDGWEDFIEVVPPEVVVTPELAIVPEPVAIPERIVIPKAEAPSDPTPVDANVQPLREEATEPDRFTDSFLRRDLQLADLEVDDLDDLDVDLNPDLDESAAPAITADHDREAHKTSDHIGASVLSLAAPATFDQELFDERDPAEMDGLSSETLRLVGSDGESAQGDSAQGQSGQRRGVQLRSWLGRFAGVDADDRWFTEVIPVIATPTLIAMRMLQLAIVFVMGRRALSALTDPSLTITDGLLGATLAIAAGSLGVTALSMIGLAMRGPEYEFITLQAPLVNRLARASRMVGIAAGCFGLLVVLATLLRWFVPTEWVTSSTSWALFGWSTIAVSVGFGLAAVGAARVRELTRETPIVTQPEILEREEITR